MAEKRRRHGRPGADGVVGPTPHLRLRLSQFEQRLEALQDVVGNNTDVFAAGFDAADRRIYTLMRVVSDVATGRSLYLVSDGVDERIDYMQYFAEYEAIQALIVLAKVHGPAVQVEESEADYEESAVIFGGAST